MSTNPRRRNDRKLIPVSIAAIATASVAVLLVLLVTTLYLSRRIRRRGSPGTSASRQLSAQPSRHFRSADGRALPHAPNLTPTRPDRRGTFTTWGFGYPGAAPSVAHGAEYPPIAPSPSTGQTTLVTPTSSTGKAAKKGWFALARGKGDNEEFMADQYARSPIVLQPESEEMVVVTYEEGLMKLGLSRPHHIIHSDTRAETNTSAGGVQARQGLPYAPASPRPSPGRGPGNDRTMPRGLEVVNVHTPLSVSSAERTREWARSPLDRTSVTPSQPVSAATTNESGVTLPSTAAANAGRMAATRAGETVAGARSQQSTWLPSYYHAPGVRYGREADEESELDYQAVAGTGSDLDGWRTSRI